MFQRLTEHNLLAFFPHLSHYSFSWIHNSSKSATQREKRFKKYILCQLQCKKRIPLPDFNVFVRSKCLEDMLSSNPHCAQTMQDRLVETTNGGKFRKDLTTQPMNITSIVVESDESTQLQTYMKWVIIATQSNTSRYKWGAHNSKDVSHNEMPPTCKEQPATCSFSPP